MNKLSHLKNRRKKQKQKRNFVGGVPSSKPKKGRVHGTMLRDQKVSWLSM